jgi:alpha-1,2-mannosyltransferase
LNQASQTTIFGNFTFSVVVATSVISISRIFALWHYYHAPMMVSLDFQMTELSRLLNDTGFLPVYPPTTREEEKTAIDFSPLKEFNLTVCLGKEWHRFTGHYLIPNGIRVDFIKSEFDGMLPRHFGARGVESNDRMTSYFLFRGCGG